MVKTRKETQEAAASKLWQPKPLISQAITLRKQARGGGRKVSFKLYDEDVLGWEATLPKIMSAEMWVAANKMVREVDNETDEEGLKRARKKTRKELLDALEQHREGQAGGWPNYRKHMKEYIGEDQARYQRDMARLLETQARRKDAIRGDELIEIRRKKNNIIIPTPKDATRKEKERIRKANWRLKNNISQAR